MATAHTVRFSLIEEQILKRLSDLIEKEVSEAVQLIIFGSRSRGGSDENSDLDAAIILNVPYIDTKKWDKLWDIKWRVLESLQAEEFPLSLSLITLDDLMSRDFGIEKIIKAEGVVIWKREN